MGRIRSVHPGLFTDEAFISLSDAAQVFFIGLWTEADDQGVFEWKPITLRARLRPAKDGSVEELLAELEANNCVKRFSFGGRQFGAVRNFRKYQRPKKPNSTHVLPDEFRTYVALSGSSSELGDQREEGGEDEGGKEPPSGSNEPSGGGARKRSPAPTRLPSAWRPSEKNAAFAKSRGVPQQKIPYEADKFRSHFHSVPGERGLKADWDAAWEHWIIESCERRGYSAENVVAGPRTIWIATADQRWTAAVRAYRAEKGKDPPRVSGQGGEGYYFPAYMLEDAA